jgi:hypothetical protein
MILVSACCFAYCKFEVSVLVSNTPSCLLSCLISCCLYANTDVHSAWLRGDTVWHSTAAGYDLQFDTSASAAAAAAAAAQRAAAAGGARNAASIVLPATSRVRTSRGNATVVGVCEGVTWFHVDGETGAWFCSARGIAEGQAVGLYMPSGGTTEQVSAMLLRLLLCTVL